jgi:8-oxo-dGTP diphosphatase
MSEKKHVFVVAAVIMHGGKVLCTQRASSSKEYISKKWEFPGGKVEEGETEAQAIQREILEELGIQIQAEREFTQVEHEYPDFKITMKTFICDWVDGDISLREHIAYKFLDPEEMQTLDWAEADIPIVGLLTEMAL